MITDKETNKLYLSALLEKDYPLFFQNFKKALDENGIKPDYLPETKDVWCVDFMPIQISESEFVQFKFNPKYLRPKKYHKTISDTSLICKQIDLSPSVTDIIADGGNVTRTKNKVIMTTRVIEENPQYSVKQLTDKITELLEIDQLILIPTQPDDFTGHSDGMVRFLDEHTILLNDYSKEPDQEFVRSLQASLHNTGLDIIEIPTSIFDNQDTDDATGDYINYLQMDSFIFVPTFKRKEDDQVVKQFEDLFQGTTIVPVESNQLSKDGGILNCISWNIKK
ncbi:MAG: agmatine deiminase family protein [Flavobacteriales bacterium]|nr:agmatine deiminase family protein [Flavobacteriales bacterium]